MDKVFSQLVSDLCEFKSISFEGKTCKGTVTCIMGDNLSLKKFSSAQYFCRYCLATKAEFQSNPLTVFTPRDLAGYNATVQFLESHPEFTMHQGIKGDSIFNKLSNFHVCQPGLPPCLAHDLFEGVVDYDVALCL